MDSKGCLNTQFTTSNLSMVLKKTQFHFQLVLKLYERKGQKWRRTFGLN